ncbi:MAG: hypothetical protein H6751_03890 [Candidatus Omnitrophica bacterium]|nr:hypothetical protein [Candidatus Omnitrophota bacterium]
MRLLLALLLISAFALPAPSQEPPAATARYPEIMKLIQQKKFQEALEIVRPMRKENPENPEVHLFETAILEGMGDFRNCEKLANEFIQKHPESVNLDQAYFLLGSAQVKGGTREKGFEALRKASEITDDPSLQSQIERMIASILQSSDRIGIQLGGAPPITPEQKEKLCRVSIRILKRALRDYFEQRQDYPENLDRLLEGDPPILITLPANPFALDGRFEYRKTESGFELTEPIGK